MKEVKKEKKEAVVVTVVGARKEGTGMGPRKSRSKERPRANNNNNGSSEVLFFQSVTLSSVICAEAKFERLRADQGKRKGAGADPSQEQVFSHHSRNQP